MIDLNEWHLEDPDGSLSVLTDRVNWTKADRTTPRYIEKEIKIVNDFQHSFIVYIKEGYVEDQLNRGLLRLWEIRNNRNNRVWINARKTNIGWTIHFQQRHQGRELWVYNGTDSLKWETQYIVKLQRTGNQYRLIVLNEETNKLCVDTGKIQGINLLFHRLWIAATIKSRRNNGNWSTGYIENLTIS